MRKSQGRVAEGFIVINCFIHIVSCKIASNHASSVRLIDNTIDNDKYGKLIQGEITIIKIYSYEYCVTLVIYKARRKLRYSNSHKFIINIVCVIYYHDDGIHSSLQSMIVITNLILSRLVHLCVNFCNRVGVEVFVYEYFYYYLLLFIFNNKRNFHTLPTYFFLCKTSLFF
jgi:hypothetical protein